ncbi:C6 finger domain protein [Zymoseptoria brevis]|uniref:C6 finger domain protein n=1 Tax=Zymoseptoria brevis TaxID=1047168 RepID=A0A0F4GGM9_9PEZI|nr:C6 finger domain protein [Zymoseptoria brevis]
MAEGSPLPFPSPSAILGDNAPSDSADREPEPPKKHVRKQSRETKKEPLPPRKAPALDDPSKDVKPKQTKSRNGCVTCKSKRLKCGEEKPNCQNCIRRGVQCGGYKKVFQWREFTDPTKPALDRQKSGQPRASPPQAPAGLRRPSTATSSGRPPTRQASADSPASASSKPPTPSGEHPPRLHHPPQVLNDSHGRRAGRSPHAQNEDVDRARQRGSQTSTPQEIYDNPRDSACNSPADELPTPAPPSRRPLSTQHEFTGAEDASGVIAFNPQSVFAYRSRSLEPSARVNSPTMTEFFMSPIQDDPGQNFVPFSMPDDVNLPVWASNPNDPALLDDNMINGDIDIVGPIQPTSMDTFIWPSRYPSPLLDSQDDGSGMWDGSMNALVMQPDFPIGSPESLMRRYDNHTCGILSIIDGPTENPWRNLVWPLAQSSPALYHAVLAMTAFHACTDEPALRLVGHEHKHRSIQNIQNGIREDSMTHQAAIGTALALGFCESWDQHTATGNSHIKGAQAMVKRALRDHTVDPLSGVELARLKFLCNAWVYMDVVARLTSFDSTESNDFENAFIFSGDSPGMILGNEQPGFGIDFGMPIDARLDPLMGCAGTLFPIIGKVANLIRKVCRSQFNSPGIISQARDLVESLESWSPPEYIERPEDPSTDVQHALQTAEAYRWATLLHLHQAVRELPSMTTAEFAQRALQYLATVPLSSRTINAQTYPMMVAGCEASDPEDREWVRGRWEAMGARKRIGVIEKCLAVTEEVWRRRDRYQSRPRERRRLVATADLRAARRRGGQVARRPPPDRHNASPGRTGMVFSYVENDTEGSKSGGPDNRRPGSGRPSKLVDMNDPDIVAYTVRGHLHWVGVMWDWGWEVLLS